MIREVQELSIIRDRLHAGKLLCEKLKAHKDSEAVVVAIPYGGIPVAYQVAKELNLPLEIMPCKKIRHPACRGKSIGSVGLEETIVHEEGLEDIPHDYIAHQIRTLRSGMKQQSERLTKNREVDLRGKTIILVDDRLKTGDTMLAGLRSVQKQNPAQVIVAVPVATTEGAQIIKPEVDDIICLQLYTDVAAVMQAFKEFVPVDENEAIELLNKSLREN